MDCFYAAIEMRNNPSLANQPVAVGGDSDGRGVICTCNYIARKFNVHAALASRIAKQRCPKLIILKPDINKYREVSQTIRKIFYEYSDLVEPISLDEAYIDVTDSKQHQSSATWIAKAIREKIYSSEKLTASAGIAPNKFLAKIASDWHKPNGQFTITTQEIADFIKKLPVTKIFGVGKVTGKKLQNSGINTCADLQKISLSNLQQQFGVWGSRLYELARGIDHREVQSKRTAKSCSVEHTFPKDLPNFSACLQILPKLEQNLLQRLNNETLPPIKKIFVKIKFHDFSHTSVETVANQIDLDCITQLCQQAFQRGGKPVRLLGIGVRFATHSKPGQFCFDNF